METETEVNPRTGPIVGTGGEWDLAGNIKGPSGSVSGIPDPLVLNTIRANTALQVGAGFRIIPNLSGVGGQIQTSSDGGTTWTTVAAWP